MIDLPLRAFNIIWIENYWIKVPSRLSAYLIWVSTTHFLSLYPDNRITHTLHLSRSLQDVIPLSGMQVSQICWVRHFSWIHKTGVLTAWCDLTERTFCSFKCTRLIGFFLNSAFMPCTSERLPTHVHADYVIRFTNKILLVHMAIKFAL